MNEDDIPAPKFAGRTYSRSRQNTTARAFDETVDSKIVPVKAAMSISKWGKANYVPVREGSDDAAEPKKAKLETRAEDPFSFDTDDRRRLSPVKKQEMVLPEQKPHQTTRLPASRIVVKGDGCEEYMKAQKDEAAKSQAFQSYSRTSQRNPTIMDDQCEEVDKKTASGQTVFFSEARISSQDLKDDDEEEDDIFPIKFKRDPLKTYSGEVVTPVDKPDSPPQRKSGYRKKGGPRGRKPLTVSDPDLIEEYKRNYAAQQMKGKPDTSTGGLSNSTVVSKQELANDDQGTTVVVVCKPKGQLEKGDVQTKYFAKNSKSKGALALATSEASLEETSGANGNNNNSSIKSFQNGAEIVPTRTSARLRNASAVAANSEGNSSSSKSASVLPENSPTFAKNPTRSKNSNASSGEPGSLPRSSASSDNNSQGNGSSGPGGKRYRIFKSRAPQVIDNKPPAFKDEEIEELSSPGSKQELNPSGDLQDSSVNDRTVFVQIDVQMEEDMQPSSRTLEESQPCTETPSTVELELDAVAVKQIDPVTARELLAARLRNMEKGNDSDSTGEIDNLSECSELLPSQESVSSSQNASEEGSQKEGAGSAPRKFFKSKKSLSGSSDLQKKLFANSPQKTPAKATYNARSWYSEHEEDGDKEESTNKMVRKEDDTVILVRDLDKAPKLKREVHWPERQFDEAYTSLKVNKTHKELYTVVHNVKQTHEVQELGETQDFMDEVDYLLDSLRNTNSTTIRCLSCLKLAGKCISPGFRMHMRAHGTVSKIFSLLHDACSDPSLALSTSAVMFMLSRDRLNMDLDQESLNLMLKLNEVDGGDKATVGASSLRELEKTKQKVKELLGQLQQETHAREIDLGFVSTGNLAMESLLSLTSRRAGEWFKEELRSVGGLDHIVDSVKVCESNLPEDLSQDIQKALPVLRKLDRCLRVLENISFMNSDNQNYLISYKNAALLQACTRTLRLCQQCMPVYKLLESQDENKALKELPGYTILTCMLAVLRVMLNVTHENQLGNLDMAIETSLMETVIRCLTTTQWCIPSEQRFDLAVLCLGLLINLVEHRETNRKVMMSMETQVKYTERSQPKTTSAIKAVVELFVQREEAAREMEENAEGSQDETTAQSPNKSGEWEETDTGIQWITNNLKKAKEEQEKQKEVASVTAKEDCVEGDEGNQSILEDDEETFTKALHKAGKHMENSIVASYAGLLLGSTIIDNKEYALCVKKLVPNEDFGPMIKLLKKFLNFMSLTTAFGNTDVNGITKVIEVLESS